MPVQSYIEKRISADRLAVIEQANEIIAEYSAKGFSLTLRQLYYQFVSRGLLANKDREYKRLGDIISDGRMTGLIDWDAITDRLREIHDRPHWGSPQDFLKSVGPQFYVDHWVGQERRVEVWVEKDALSDIIRRACQPLDVPFMVCRGFMSQTAMWEAGARVLRNWREHDQNTLILHLGDHDPSGIDMTRDIADRVNIFTQEFPVAEIKRIALNMDQVEEYSPPPNPAKETDSRSESYIAQYGAESWELDALDPSVLDALIVSEIQMEIDQDLWKARQKIVNEGREVLSKVADNYEAVAEFVQVNKKKKK